MPTFTNLTIVNKATGATVFEVDETGVRDSSDGLLETRRVFTARLFATPLAAYMWRCIEGVWQVSGAVADCSVTGSTSCTVDVLVCATAVAPGSGTTQLAAAMDIEATAPFAVNGVLIASPTEIFPGMLLARVIAGTPSTLEGILTVQLKRIG